MAETLLFNALREAIDEEMGRDETVFVLGEDVGQYGGSYKVTKDLYQKYGEWRVLDTPIAENSFTGMAVGAAMTGLRPIIEGMNMGFLLLAFNQIANNAGMLRYTSGGNYKIPMVIPSTPSGSKPISKRCRGSKLSPAPPPTTPRGCSNPPFGTTTRCCSLSMCCSTT